jgi:regulator of protease activity HflC (stomatin/prohibitin superfamily)
MQASQKLLEAAETLSRQPQAMQLRYLQTLTEVANETSNTILFPLPIDLVAPLLKTAAPSVMPPASRREGDEA